MLQGSLENFALDEVLGLLSGTAKTGHLEIAGNRGTGSLVFHEGRLVDGSASFTANGIELEDVMFELLRYQDGTFTFNPREVVPADAAENVATVLSNAEVRLQDWRSIESVVPSLNHQVVPVMELPSDEVTVSRDEWATLMTVGSGCPVSHVCDRLTLGEVEGSRRIKDLAERLLVNVAQPTGAYRRNRSAEAAGSGVKQAPVTAGSTTSVPTAPVSSSTPATPPPALAAPPAALAAPAEVPAAVAAPAAASSNGNGNGSTSNGLSETADSLEALAESASAPAGGSALGALIADRPAAPTVPVAEESTSDSTSETTPPGPPSPSEIAGFGDKIEDASELTKDENAARGGVLARYLKGE